MGRQDFLEMGGAGLAGAALLGSGTLAGCGFGGFNGEVVLSFGREPSGTLEALIEKFNDQNKDISVRWRRMASKTDEYFEQLRTEFRAQSAEITLVGGDVIWPAQFAADGYIVNLSDRFTEGMRKEFLPGPVESNTYDGKVYGVPWYTDVGLLYYREDLLEKSGFSGPPGSWDELEEQARKVMQDAGTRYGYVFQGGRYEGGTVNGLEFINGYGGRVLDPDDPTKVTIDSPESVAGLTTQRRLVADGVAPPAVGTYTESECEGPFLGGDAVFCRNWPYMFALAGSGDSIEADRIGLAPLPAGEGGESVCGLGGWNFFINAAADPEAQDAAFEFVKFMTAEEQQRTFAVEGSYLPTPKSLYDDPEVEQSVPTVALAPRALTNAEPRPVSPVYSDMSLEMAEQFTANVKGEVQPQEAVSELQQRLQGIVDQAPRDG